MLVVATVASVLAAGRMAALAEARTSADRRAAEQADRQRERAERAASTSPGSARPRAPSACYDSATAAQAPGPVPPRARRPGPPRLGVVVPRPLVPPRAARRFEFPAAVTIFSLDVSPDGRFLVAVGGNPYHYGPAYTGEPATVHVYDLPGLTLRRTLAGHWDKANTVAFRPDGKRLATAASDGRVKLWDARRGGRCEPSREASPTTSRDGSRSWAGAPTDVVSPSASRRASGSGTRKPCRRRLGSPRRPRA